MLLQNPLLQPVLILVQRQIPVLGLLQYRSRTRDCRFWINQLSWRKVTSALLTLVAIGTLVVAVWALTSYIAVGQELLSLLVVQLLSSLLSQLALVVEFLEPFGSKLMVSL